MKIDTVKLTLWMNEMDMSDAELARRCEVSVTAIRLIRIGESVGSKKLIKQISEVLEVPSGYITKD